MPVYRPQHVPVPQWQVLVDELADEIGRPTQRPGAPAVYEDEVPQTQLMHVLVIWPRWEEVPQERRGAIILDAYEQADEARKRQIRFAIGVTPDEAIRGGYLPYKIETSIRRSDRIDPAELRRALEDAGAWQTPTGLELRFPYRWLAERVLAELQGRFGEHAFALSEDLGSVGQWAGNG